MPNATQKQRAEVEAAVKAASHPYVHHKQPTPEVEERLRVAVFEALYELATKQVIPPEVKLDVEATLNADGTIKLGFTLDFMLWFYGDSAKLLHLVYDATKPTD